MSKRNPRNKNPSPATPDLIRINKVLASAGLGSRRQVEELVLQGRVEVDGETVVDLGTRVDPRRAKIKVDGVNLHRPKLVYYALNKPKGVVSTNRDPDGRPRVVDYVPDRERVFSVGRLDLHSEGLVLLTNDGSLAQNLAHPRFRVQKTYFVVVAGVMTADELNRLRKGVYLAEGVARIDGARIRKTRKTCTELEIQLSEGKNREIRRILARAGHKVVLLRRISIGPLRLGELPVGAARELSPNEVRALYLCTTSRESQPAGSTSNAVTASQSSRRTKKSKIDSESSKNTFAGAEYHDSEDIGQGNLQSGRIVSPLELPESDDFGLGLDYDNLPEDPSFSSEFGFSEDGLSNSENISDDLEDDDWDDDFAINLSVQKKTGKVIGVEVESKQPREN